MVQVTLPTDPVLAGLLENHPEVRVFGEEVTAGQLTINQSGWLRKLYWNGEPAEVRGLLELIDNNPVVCADSVSIPTDVATLAAIALGPILRANLAQAEPALMISGTLENPEDLIQNLEVLGLKTKVDAAVDPAEFQSVLALNAMVEIPVTDDPSAIDDLFDEAYGRSFYVRRLEEGQWDIDLVSNRPYAAYRLRLSPGESTNLLTIQVLADKNGKAGACQVIHALDIMLGFEESLGIPQNLF